MGQGPGPRRGHANLSRIALRVGNEFVERGGWKGWMHHKDAGLTIESSDGQDVAQEIVIEFVVKRRIDRGGRGDEKQRVAVRCRAYDNLGRNRGARARSIFDDERLAEPLR